MPLVQRRGDTVYQEGNVPLGTVIKGKVARDKYALLQSL